MIYLMLLMATVAAAFCVGLGLIALAQDPGRRLSRSFAALNLTLATANLSGYAVLIGSRPLALAIYRLMQLGTSALLIPYVRFMQEVLGIYDNPTHRKIRRITDAYALLSAPLYFTPYLIVDFRAVEIFSQRAGPLYPLHVTVLASVFASYAGLAFFTYRRSSGLKRNQVKFVVLAAAIGPVELVLYALSFTPANPFWIYFPLQIVMSYCLAYAISEYRLLDFNLWMRRVVFFVGAYCCFAAAPFILNLLGREWLVDEIASTWALLPTLMVIYAVPLALIPAMSSFLRSRAEQRRLADLRRQLDVVRATTERLARERGATREQIADEVITVLGRFYLRHSTTPVTHIVFFAPGEEGDMALAYSGTQEIDAERISRLGDDLRALPASMVVQPLGPGASEADDSLVGSDTARAALQRVRRYLSDERIEVCCPCVHNGQVHAVILFGQKRRGIFWPEELATLAAAGSHVGIALHNAQLVAQTQELRDLDRLKKELISNITHEFKAPLHILGNAADMLAKGIQAPSQQDPRNLRYLGMIRNNTTRLAMFIENLLEAAQIDQPRLELEWEACDLWEIIAGAIGAARPLAEERGLIIEVPQGTPLHLIADAEKLRQVFVNLLINAVKCTPAGRISVRAKLHTDTVTISVEDTGQGIEAHHLSSIFDRFFHVGPHRGSGLGLAIVKAHVEAHGGQVHAESPGLGRGSTFVVELPLERDSVE